MQINNNKIFSSWFKEVKEVENKTTLESAQIYPKKIEKDSVRFSEDALVINRMMTQLLAEKEEIRYEKVNKIQTQIENGDYKISAKDVVAKLLEG